MVCVTGGSGYIASWLVKLLLERGYAVKATVRDPSKTSSVTLSHFNWFFLIWVFFLRITGREESNYRFLYQKKLNFAFIPKGAKLGVKL